jgi:hypothetical protein
MVGFRRPEKMRADHGKIGKCPEFSQTIFAYISGYHDFRDDSQVRRIICYVL